MSLSVTFGNATNFDGNPSWMVWIMPADTAIPGFGRKQDAEIAMQFLQTLPVDWGADTKQAIMAQTRSLGLRTHKDVHKVVAPHLQW